ncbi:MAG TPA: hypothetical protein VLQ20_11610 [Planococcus sp. (in: firmicutes)]|nr:hypothetical protein [Planococcus sp. (in: firmicutes)]
MIALQFISGSLIDFEFTNLIHEHNLVLILGIVVLFIAVLLRALRTAIVEVLLLSLLFASTEVFNNPLYIALLAIQLALVMWVLWKVKGEADITYIRRLEKTLKKSRNITRGGNAGDHHFLF